MEFPSNESATSEVERALSVLVENTEDDAALDALAGSEVLVPVPDDTDDDTAADPTTVALPVLEQDGETPLVPVFTSELRMAELLPYVSRYRLVPLGALASQWPTGDLSLTIDASSPHGLTLNSEGVRTLLARPRG
ncbi:SseB family protein [Streptomyces sporangiiformans]|uniref:SseB family protein n=1 Tax=Streptomyces sporangiiformans TaxID=2315329 RepID=A0A505DHL1_9ACTN|nr:SseB family protein [Streptomyces sporangiiformans]TPQ22440.1 SseB family protein [Streptomyces sporangiiformans]